LWNPARGEGGSIRSGSFTDLDKLYQARIRLLQKGKYKPNPKDPTEMITPIEDVIAEAGLSRGSQSDIPQVPQGNTKYQVGQIIDTPRGKFVVTGGDLNNDPDVEPAS
jgi:hypothetical protein